MPARLEFFKTEIADTVCQRENFGSGVGLVGNCGFPRTPCSPVLSLSFGVGGSVCCEIAFTPLLNFFLMCCVVSSLRFSYICSMGCVVLLAVVCIFQPALLVPTEPL